MNFQFQHKELSWLFAGVPILVLLFIALLVWKKKVRNRVGDKKLVHFLTSNYSHTKFIVKFFFILLAFAAGVIAAINPRKPGENSSVIRKGIDVAIALDVSKSMLAADIAPNRLERAKQFVNRLMNEMPDDRIALILFAGKAYLQMPLTADHTAASLFISSASPEAIPQQGTVISDALNMSANAFNAVDRKYKAVVLITDGEDHDDNAIETAKELGQKGMMVNTVGIGSPEGTSLPGNIPGESKKDEAGNSVISKLNENILKELAQATNGVYVRLQSGDDAVDAIKTQLSQIDKKAFNDTSAINFKNYYWVFVILMLLFLLTDVFINERRRVDKNIAAA